MNSVHESLSESLFCLNTCLRVDLLDCVILVYLFEEPLTYSPGFPRWLSNKENACDAEDTGDGGAIPGWGRSPGGGHGNPLQCSCLGNPMDRGAWRAAAPGPRRVGRDGAAERASTQTIPQGALCMLRSHQRCANARISPHPCQRLLVSVFWSQPPSRMWVLFHRGWFVLP